MRSYYAWAIVVAILAAALEGPGRAVGAVLAVVLLLAGDRDERLARGGAPSAGAEDPTP